MSKIKVAPSILSADFGKMAEAVANIKEWGADWIHCDVMDGVYVPNITFGMPMVTALRGYSDMFLDVHLMITEPEKHVGAFCDSGADMVTFHPDASKNPQLAIDIIKSKGKLCGVVLNADQPFSVIEPYLDKVDMVLIMSVNPGFGGQKFIPATFRKVSELRAKLDVAGRTDCLIQVDGGCCVENTAELVKAGADVLVSGSAFFGFPPFKERLAAFMAAAEQK